LQKRDSGISKKGLRDESQCHGSLGSVARQLSHERFGESHCRTVTSTVVNLGDPQHCGIDEGVNDQKVNGDQWPDGLSHKNLNRSCIGTGSMQKASCQFTSFWTSLPPQDFGLEMGLNI
jgi:hypothetical protein